MPNNTKERNMEFLKKLHELFEEYKPKIWTSQWTEEDPETLWFEFVSLDHSPHVALDVTHCSELDADSISLAMRIYDTMEPG